MLKKINENIKTAMRNKKTAERNILRMVLSKAKLIAKNDNDRELTDKDILVAIRKQIKQNKETIVCLIEGKRDTSKEDFEVEILSTYLPTQMSFDEMQKIVKKIVETIPEEDKNPKSKGLVMGKLSQYRDSIDMKEASKFADTFLVG